MDHFQIVTVDVATPELASVSVVANGTLSFDDWDSALNSSEVAITGTVTHAINTDKVASDGWQPNARVNISCNNLTITPEGKIDVVGKGFQGGEAASQANGYGPGWGRGTLHRGGGGGYGNHGSGLVGGGYNAYGGVAYGSVSKPDLPGSGGGSSGHAGGGAGGAGGGLVQISATGNVDVSGLISANGATGVSLSGGGSGGGIYIKCATMSGNGTVTSKGGTNYAGGSGGRIAIDVTDPVAQALLSPNVKFSSETSIATGDATYGDGSLYFSSQTFYPYETLSYGYYVLYLGTSSVLKLPSLTVTSGHVSLYGDCDVEVEGDLTVWNSGARFVMTNGNLTCGGSLAIGNGGTVQLHSSPTNGVSPGYGNRVYVSGDFTVFTNGLVRVYSHPTNGGSVFFDVNTLRVFANGSLSANAGGFFGRLKTGGTGPGAGLTSGADRGGGGGYGGKGATSTYDTSRPAKGGSAYGSAVLPLLCGSSGGRNGGAGGGLIWMRVRGSTFVDGVVPANGGIPGSTLDGEKAEPGTVVFLTAPPHATLMIVR